MHSLARSFQFSSTKCNSELYAFHELRYLAEVCWIRKFRMLCVTLQSFLGYDVMSFQDVYEVRTSLISTQHKNPTVWTFLFLESRLQWRSFDNRNFRTKLSFHSFSGKKKRNTRLQKPIFLDGFRLKAKIKGMCTNKGVVFLEEDIVLTSWNSMNCVRHLHKITLIMQKVSTTNLQFVLRCFKRLIHMNISWKKIN